MTRQQPATALDALWDEMLWDACASDGPIRDDDVRQAIKHYRPRIEAEAAAPQSAEAVALREAALRAYRFIGRITPEQWRAIDALSEVEEITEQIDAALANQPAAACPDCRDRPLGQPPCHRHRQSDLPSANQPAAETAGLDVDALAWAARANRAWAQNVAQDYAARLAMSDPEAWRVHNHGPQEGRGTACREYYLNGRLVGACKIVEATSDPEAGS